jgi:hypothetical protein
MKPARHDVRRTAIAQIALSAAGAAVLVGLVVLALRVSAATPQPQLDPGHLARAAARPPGPSSSAPAAPAPSLPSPSPAPSAMPVPVGQIPLDVVLQADDSPEPDPAESDEGPAAQAIRLYDRGRYQEARDRALRALELEPADDRMLRIATSSSCVLRDAERARAFHGRLSPKSQRQMARRCRRYGIEL